MDYYDIYKIVYKINEFQTILNPYSFAKDFDIDIIELNEKEFNYNMLINNCPYTMDGYCVYKDNKFTIYINNGKPKTRINFTLWHEIGHIFLKHFSENMGLDEDTKEKHANCFARNMLIPHVLYEQYYIWKYPRDKSMLKFQEYLACNVSDGAIYVKSGFYNIDYYYCYKFLAS